MCKERWCEIAWELEEELGREPTGEEVNDAYADNMASFADYYKDAAKYGEL